MREGIRRQESGVRLPAVWAAALVTVAVAVVRAQAPVLSLTATADSAGSIKIDVLRWSTDAEREQLLAAWTQPGAGGGAQINGRRLASSRLRLCVVSVASAAGHFANAARR